MQFLFKAALITIIYFTITCIVSQIWNLTKYFIIMKHFNFKHAHFDQFAAHLCCSLYFEEVSIEITQPDTSNSNSACNFLAFRKIRLDVGVD